MSLVPQPDSFYWPAAAEDHWFRHIIESGAVSAKEPRLRAKYVADRLRIVDDRPWRAEISGRILSKSYDIVERAEAAAEAIGKAGIRFRHVAFVKVRAVRTDPNFDVIESPLDDDVAHANLVAYSVPLAPAMQQAEVTRVSHDFVKSLCGLMNVLDAPHVGPLEVLRLPVQQP